MKHWIDSIPQIWTYATAIAVVIVGATAWWLNVLRIKKLYKKPCVSENNGSASAVTYRQDLAVSETLQPSATTYLRECLLRLRNDIESYPEMSAVDIERKLDKTLSGRKQLLMPIKERFMDRLRQAKKSKSASTGSAIIDDIAAFIHKMDEAQCDIAVIGQKYLESFGGELVDSIVLADFSLPVSSVLKTLAQNYASKHGSVTIHLVSADTHFISSQDTTRWSEFFAEGEMKRFYHVKEPTPFSSAAQLFERLLKEGTINVLMLGAERILPDGRMVVFPGIRAISTRAVLHRFHVLVVAESYKVLPAARNDNVDVGSDTEGATVELASLEMSSSLSLITDHQIHEYAPSDDKEIQATSSHQRMYCCIRHWNNRLEEKHYPIGIIFDLDGTLLDSELTHIKLYQEAGRNLGYELTNEEYETSLRGKTDEDIIHYMASATKRCDQEEYIIRIKQEKFIAHLRSGEVPPMPGSVDFVKQLSSQHFKLAVVTSATWEELTVALEILGCRNSFQVLVSAESVENGKPAPDPYLKAATLLGLMPRECLVYEDAVAGIYGAVAAGMTAVAIGLQDESCQRVGALFSIKDFCGHSVPELPNTT